ncbi:N-acetylmuramoyl-L-alanine amidase [Streptomyces sp. ME02-6978a]|uniref:N-acetylmuramoyl-L-alanine amidase n=1 Tax=Streptomyces TaxID=1883 RepID=UPI0029A9375D|nr:MULTISPECIES: N-acetylmuramoyl-L-alanine amidase [unclassified Streptomyces]MDX3088957.1 N-acetylmuramoyl-L-alanine amidase [Streptomyces sp. ME12-02E]MDX3334548.1 N-acetylmuramoyl-L-alanine amidase [Streptomyces sp. ME02-6978a]
MSYLGPEFEPVPQRRSRRGPFTVALAALVPAVLAGWLVYEVVGDSGGSGPSAQAAGASGHSAAPSSPRAKGGAEGAGSPSASGRTDGKDPDSLRGKVVVIDPGHNQGNFKHPAEINRRVDIGTNSKECDTTGTATNAGYPEARFTLDVSRRLRTLLEERGATVKLTHDGDRPWGPCVTERAEIGNKAHADAALSIHADGSAVGNRGFHVILPDAVHSGTADTRAIAGPSRDLGVDIKDGFARATGTAPSNYIGGGTGLDVRKDLGGLNLSTVPKVFIECGNMRDSKDAALLTSAAWRQKAAEGMSEGIVSFLRG